MKESTILLKHERVSKRNRNLSTSLMKHDLLLDDPLKRSQHRIDVLSCNNIYTFRGRELSSEKDRKVAFEYLNALHRNDNDKIDLRLLSRTKIKFKKWLKSNKIVDQEKQLYKQVLKFLDSDTKKLSKDKVLNHFDEITGVRRQKDKRKALETIVELQNLRLTLNIDQGSPLSCCFVFVILKIPGHNEIDLNVKQQENLLIEYYSTTFGQYEILYSVIHADESVPHVHLMINAKNKDTNEFDFVQKCYEHVKAKYNLNYCEKHSHLTKTQVSNVGQLLQLDFYEFINAHQVNCKFSLKKYASEQDKIADRQYIKADTSKPIASREYNTAQKLAKENNSARQKLSEMQAKVLKYQDEILKLEKAHSETQRQITLDIQKQEKKAHEVAQENSEAIKKCKENLTELEEACLKRETHKHNLSKQISILQEEVKDYTQRRDATLASINQVNNELNIVKELQSKQGQIQRIINELILIALNYAENNLSGFAGKYAQRIETLRNICDPAVSVVHNKILLSFTEEEREKLNNEIIDDRYENHFRRR